MRTMGCLEHFLEQGRQGRIEAFLPCLPPQGCCRPCGSLRKKRPWRRLTTYRSIWSDRSEWFRRMPFCQGPQGSCILSRKRHAGTTLRMPLAVWIASSSVRVTIMPDALPSLSWLPRGKRSLGVWFWGLSGPHMPGSTAPTGPMATGKATGRRGPRVRIDRRWEKVGSRQRLPRAEPQAS